MTEKLGEIEAIAESYVQKKSAYAEAQADFLNHSTGGKAT